MAPSFPNSRNDSNSDFPKSGLTLISEYQKYRNITETRGQAIMQSSGWAAEHCDALREYLASGMSYAEIADAINAKFNSCYSRNAAIGRARRMGLSGPEQPGDGFAHWPKRPPRAKASRLSPPRERHVPVFLRPMPDFERVEQPELRCVEIVPRHLALIELEPGDCRYPYGGDEEGEAITFCGHPQLAGSSYCAPHFHLTLGPAAPLPLAAGTVSLRPVEAA
jgi:GcrA cell cycle regulator